MSIQHSTTRTSPLEQVGSWLRSVSDSRRENASLFLYLGSEAPDIVSWAKKMPGGGLTIKTGSLQDFVNIADASPTVFVPGPDVVLMDVTIPPGNRARALQSAPYLIEDDLAADVESLHFAFGKKKSAGKTPVAIVSREKMAAWLNILSEAGIEPRSVVPVIVSVPDREGKWSIVAADDHWLVKGRGLPFCADYENLASLLELAGDFGAGGGRSDIVLFADQETGSAITRSLPDHTVECVAASFLQTMVEGYEQAPEINLLQGPFSKSAEWRNVWNRYQFFFWAFVVLGIMSVSGFALDYSGLRSADKRLDAEMRAVFLETFQDSKRSDNPRMRMESRLKANRMRESRRDVFFKVYDLVVPILNQGGENKVLALRFKDGRFDFEMEVESLERLDEYKEQLGLDGKIRVDIRNASASGDRVRAILQVTEGK